MLAAPLAVSCQPPQLRPVPSVSPSPVPNGGTCNLDSDCVNGFLLWTRRLYITFPLVRFADRGGPPGYVCTASPECISGTCQASGFCAWSEQAAAKDRLSRKAKGRLVRPFVFCRVRWNNSPAAPRPEPEHARGSGSRRLYGRQTLDDIVAGGKKGLAAEARRRDRQPTSRTSREISSPASSRRRINYDAIVFNPGEA